MSRLKWVLVVLPWLMQCSYVVVSEEEKGKDPDVVDNIKDKSSFINAKYGEALKDASERPSNCQTCRVFVQELLQEMDKTKNIKKSYHLANSKRQIDYQHSEIRLMDILDVVCNNVYNYRFVQGPDFPYLRGVKSSVRDSIEKSMKESGLEVRLKADADVVADPSRELRRMFLKCTQMVEEYEDDIVHWYMREQHQPPIEYICAERIIIKSSEAACLNASAAMPEGSEGPGVWGAGEKREYMFASRHKEEL